MPVAILSIMVGVCFLLAALLELAGHWGRPLGVAISLAGIVVSVLLILAGSGILRGWARSKTLVIAAAGSCMAFTTVAASLHYMGTIAAAMGIGMGVALVAFGLRPGKDPAVPPS